MRASGESQPDALLTRVPGVAAPPAVQHGIDAPRTPRPLAIAAVADDDGEALDTDGLANLTRLPQYELQETLDRLENTDAIWEYDGYADNRPWIVKLPIYEWCLDFGDDRP